MRNEANETKHNRMKQNGAKRSNIESKTTRKASGKCRAGRNVSNAVHDGPKHSKLKQHERQGIK